jgi:hypothetical protein
MAESRRARGVVPFAASISRSASEGDSVRGSLRTRRGEASTAAGLSSRVPRSIRWRYSARSDASRRAIVAGESPSARSCAT